MTYKQASINIDGIQLNIKPGSITQEPMSYKLKFEIDEEEIPELPVHTHLPGKSEFASLAIDQSHYMFTECIVGRENKIMTVMATCLFVILPEHHVKLKPQYELNKCQKEIEQILAKYNCEFFITVCGTLQIEHKEACDICIDITDNGSMSNE